jgi:hypothetical protein
MVAGIDAYEKKVNTKEMQLSSVRRTLSKLDIALDVDAILILQAFVIRETRDLQKFIEKNEI